MLPSASSMLFLGFLEHVLSWFFFIEAPLTCKTAHSQPLRSPWPVDQALPTMRRPWVARRIPMDSRSPDRSGSVPFLETCGESPGQTLPQPGKHHQKLIRKLFKGDLPPLWRRPFLQLWPQTGQRHREAWRRWAVLTPDRPAGCWGPDLSNEVWIEVHYWRRNFKKATKSTNIKDKPGCSLTICAFCSFMFLLAVRVTIGVITLPCGLACRHQSLLSPK